MATKTCLGDESKKTLMLSSRDLGDDDEDG